MKPLFTWSYSKLSLYESCPAKYKFRYLEGKRTEKHPAAQRGTDIHTGIEDFLHRKSEEIPAPALSFTAMITEVREHRPKIEHKIGFDQNWKPAPWEDAWGRSVLDGCYHKENTNHVQEWKSGKVYDDHTDQRKLYAVLSFLVWPNAEQAIAKTYYFDQGFTKKVTIEPGHVEDIVDDFSRRVYFMETDDVCAPRPSWSCNYCDYSRLKGGPCRKG